MRLIQHYSSSEGNAYEVVASNGKRLLVECGIVWKKLQKALQYNLQGIEAAFSTHGHKDHCRAAKDVLRAGIHLHASAETFSGLGISVSNSRKAKIITDKTLVRLDSFEVFCFTVEHDCPGAFGFVIREKATNEFLLFCTDTAFIRQKFKHPFSIIALECSYSKDILQKRVDTGDIDEALAKRLLTSHMELQNAVRYVADFCDLSKCCEIHLLHLSGENIDKDVAVKTFTDRFLIKTITV